MTREEAVARIKDHIEIHRCHERNAVKIFEALDMAIKALEQPERKKGEWICSDDLYETAVCSCCGWDTTESLTHIKNWFVYCPHCGADTREDSKNKKGIYE